MRRVRPAERSGTRRAAGAPNRRRAIAHQTSRCWSCGTADGDHEKTPLPQLRAQGVGNTGCRRSDEDPIIGCKLLPTHASRRRAAARRCRRRARRGAAARARSSVGNALDAEHPLDQPREQRGLVAAAGADLEHAMLRLELRELEHARRRCRAGRSSDPRRWAARDRRRRAARTPGSTNTVARHRGHRVEHARVADAARDELLLDHAPPRGRVTVGRSDRGRRLAVTSRGSTTPSRSSARRR